MLLPLQQQSQVQILNQALQQLQMESSNFHSCEWWIKECIRGEPKSCWLGELEEGRKFVGLTREAMSEAAYNIALGIAERQDNSGERIENWRHAFAIIKQMSGFRSRKLDLILDNYKENGDVFPFTDTSFEENEFAGYYLSVVVTESIDQAIYRLASHLTFISDPKAGWTASPSLKWTSYLETDLTDLISGLYHDEQAGYAPAIEWRAMLSSARDKMYEAFYWDKDNSKSQKIEQVNTSSLLWQGSKTELAELGYALLEAGLISGPREAALKALADFFGQDLGNPAKHLQTLQKRKWDPTDKEPVTPLLDKLGTALKSMLKIKAISPVKK